jgi:glycosyltransferase involved in cell wall biosynthesis
MTTLEAAVALLAGFMVSAGSAVWLWVIARTLSTFRGLARLEKRCVQADRRVSVVIPGRNVERWVERCLGSVLAQRNVELEVIFVDDSSTDATSRIVASEFACRGVHYVRINDVPEGWRGKTWALSRGYSMAKADTVLFMDADTVLRDEYVVSDAVSALRDRDLDALSLNPRLDRSGLASKIMLPLLENIFFSMFSPLRNKDLGDPFAVLIGAFILVRREAYEAVGGHAVIRDRILDDRALAQLLKSRSYRIEVLEGSHRLSAEFAGSFRGYFNSFIRIVADYAATRDVGRIPLYVAGAFILLVLPQIALPLSLLNGNIALAAVCAANLALNLSANLGNMVKSGSRRDMALLPLTFFANWVLVAALAWSSLSLAKGSVELSWRGRRLMVRPRGLP